MLTIAEVSPQLGIAPTCAALSFPRASYYRALAPKSKKGGSPVSTRVEIIDPGASQSVVSNPRALQPEERRAILDTMHEPRFADLAPAEVYATLLDEGRYLCSERTMYRILAENREVRERRTQLRHPRYAAPELLATGPNQLWSWDITKLRGPRKWSYFHLYVILDVFSRYVVGWMVANRESAALAEHLIADTCERQKIGTGELTIHADRGSSMRSKPVALLLADLGVTKTHSRPHVSNDNPLLRVPVQDAEVPPRLPGAFGAIGDVRSFCRDFFDWYNLEHHHVGLGLLTPHDVHHGLAAVRFSARALTLSAAYLSHPERFPRGQPQPPALPTEVWINKPSKQSIPTSQ